MKSANLFQFLAKTLENKRSKDIREIETKRKEGKENSHQHQSDPPSFIPVSFWFFTYKL